MNKTFRIVTLGCSKNTVDSEVLAGALVKEGWMLHNEAQHVIINTCGFILDAKEESIEEILDWAEMKAEGDIQSLLVMGCLVERYREELSNEIPEVDAWLGVNDLHAVVQVLEAGDKEVKSVSRVLSTLPHYAYLKVSEGCDRQCSFCAIPGIRGQHISRSIEDIVEEAENLKARGVKELILIAQDLSYYGVDLYGKRSLNTLLERLLAADAPEWIRLHYLYPAGFPNAVLKTIAAHDRICNYIDIPVQHINDRILRSMKRGQVGGGTRKLLDDIRKIIPGAALRTTLIVGYPGETEDEFQELCDFVKEYRFERLGVFPYSHEEDTPAYSLNDDIPDEVKQERVDEIMRMQENISLDINSHRIGQELKVLIDRKEGDYWIGRTQYDSPEIDNEVLIDDNGQTIKAGSFYMVQIKAAEEFDLYADIV